MQRSWISACCIAIDLFELCLLDVPFKVSSCCLSSQMVFSFLFSVSFYKREEQETLSLRDFFFISVDVMNHSVKKLERDETVIRLSTFLCENAKFPCPEIYIFDVHSNRFANPQTHDCLEAEKKVEVGFFNYAKEMLQFFVRKGFVH